MLARGSEVRHMRDSQSRWRAWGQPALGILAACLALCTGLLTAEGYVQTRPEYAVDFATLAEPQADIPWASGPARELIFQLVRDDFRAHMQKALADSGAGGDTTHSLLDPSLVATVRDALRNSPWIHELKRVSIGFPRTVVVEATLSRPRVAVLHEGNFFLVDESGLVLPLAFDNGETFADFNRCLSPALRVVVNTPKPPPAGQVWDDPAIRAAMAVDSCLDPFDDRLPIETIDVGNVGGARNATTSEITLVAKPPGVPPITLLWGRDPTHAKFGENTVAQKLGILSRVLQSRPLSDVGQIDLRFPEPDWQPRSD